MSWLTVELDGLPPLQIALAENIDLQDVKDLVKSHGARMWKNAKFFAPVDTGYLRDHIEMSIFDSGLSVRVSSTAEYAPDQEFGTRYQAGTPHIGPAFREESWSFNQDIHRLVVG